jgi:hypothetical protein
VNLLGSVEIAIVIVASDLRIRRFTPMAERVLNLIPSDVGRPIGHIKPNIDCPELEEQIGAVIERVVVREIEVRDRQGRAYSLRIRPYKNIENRIDGAVLALIDIQTAKQQDGGPLRRGGLRRDARAAPRARPRAPHPPGKRRVLQHVQLYARQHQSRKLLDLGQGAWASRNCSSVSTRPSRRRAHRRPAPDASFPGSAPRHCG